MADQAFGDQGKDVASRDHCVFQTLHATPCHLTNTGRNLPRMTEFEKTRENVKDDTSDNKKTRNADQSRHLLRWRLSGSDKRESIPLG